MGDETDIDSILRGVAAAPPMRPRAPPSALVGAQVGNYRVLRLLGQGGMGAVYVAQHPLIGKQVVVKVLHAELAESQEAVARFFNEARAVNDIRHENIVDILDFGRTDEKAGVDQAYILMELLDGESVASFLERGVPSPAEAVHIIDQAAGALAAAHARKIIHRDIKPDNIFLTQRGRDPLFVKLLDFGIAKLTKNESSWKTRTGAVIGTPLYMSPEQCAGHGRIDGRSDIYSLGLVLFELLTGRPPFGGSSLVELFRGHLTEPPPRPSALWPRVPSELERIALKCLEKDPAARFASMEELRSALAAQPASPSAAPVRIDAAPRVSVGAPVHHTTLSASRGELAGRVAPPSRRGRGVVMAGLAAASLAAVVALLQARRPATHVAAPAPAAAPPEDTVEVLLDSVPEGAVIRRAGVEGLVGHTPARLRMKRSEPPFAAIFTLDGWKAEERTVSPGSEVHVVFVRDARPPAPKPPAARRKRAAPPPPPAPAADPVKPPGDPLDEKLM